MQEGKYILAEGWRLEAFAGRALLSRGMFSLHYFSTSWKQKPNKANFAEGTGTMSSCKDSSFSL